MKNIKKTNLKINCFLFSHKKFLKIFSKPIPLKYTLTLPIIKYISFQIKYVSFQVYKMS